MQEKKTVVLGSSNVFLIYLFSFLDFVEYSPVSCTVENFLKFVNFEQ